MNIKKLQNNYTTPEQSKRLLELGVPEDSADCCYYVKDKCAPIEIIPPGNRNTPHTFSTYAKGYNDVFYPENPSLFEWDNADVLPCWSVGRLMEIYLECALDYHPYDDFYTETPSLHFMAFDKDRLINEIIELFEEDKMNFFKIRGMSMKKPLTNNIYCVTVKRCASIYIEADSPKEAMKIAEHWTDEVDDEEFEGSEVEVDSCDSYADEADSDYMNTIYTADEAIDVDEYIDRYEAQDPEEVARGGWDMTNQLELQLEG